MNSLVAKPNFFSPKLLAFLLISFFFVQGLFLIPATSPTTDEVAFHIVNGYVYLKTHDYRMSPANPALIREWEALPWLFLNPKIDFSDPNWAAAESVPFCLKFFYQDNRQMAGALLYSARFMILILGAMMGLVIYLWSRRLYGDWGGILSLAFYSFCPTFLGYSAIATIDVGPAFFCVWAAYRLWRYLEKGSVRNFWFLAIVLALAFAAKYSTLFLGPVFLGLILAKKGFKCFFKSAFFFTLTSFLVIWVSYFFEFKPLLAGNVPRVGEKLGFIAAGVSHFFGSNGVMVFQELARKLPIPIPTYILGVAGIVRNHRNPFLHYWFGGWSADWHWNYYFFSFLVKMTIPFLIMLILRAIFFKKVSSRSKWDDLVLLVPVATMFVLVCFDRFAMGVRYLFPVIPLLFVWVGGLATLVFSKWWKIILGVLVALHAFVSMSVFPNEFSFFNLFVGGPKEAYKYIRGSDLDWGQGLKALSIYLKQKKIYRARLSYFGTADPSFYGIQYENLAEPERKSPLNQVYAVSLYYLDGVDWSRKLKPSAIVGGSIAVYDFRAAVQGNPSV